MPARISRLAAASGRTRYIVNCVISTLFRDRPVLLISLDPQTDPYSSEIDSLGGCHRFPDFDRIPRERSSLGANLTYVCWAPLSRTARSQTIAERDARLMSHLRAAVLVPDGSTLRSLAPLVIVDGCQHLADAPASSLAADLRRFLRACLAEGMEIIAAGENDWDTDWLDIDDAVIAPLAGDLAAEEAWHSASQPNLDLPPLRAC
jgi:hypothetical protein